MNKLEATVVSAVDRDGTLRTAPLERARSRASTTQLGEKVDLFVRPEDISLQVLANGAAAGDGLLGGRVTSLTFLGPVTTRWPRHRHSGRCSPTSRAPWPSTSQPTRRSLSRLDSASLRSITPST